jgi:hypothetical protein
MAYQRDKPGRRTDIEAVAVHRGVSLSCVKIAIQTVSV